MGKDMKRVVIIVVALLTLLAIPATVFLVMRNQEIRKRAAPATTMSITPATVTKQIGDEFTLEIHMNTADNQVVAAQVSLSFDPEKLEAVWIHNGTMFPNIISSGVVGNGVASIALGAANTTTPITGTGLVASVKMKALANTTAPVSVRFAADSFVGALGEGSVNVLTSTTPATVTIASSGGGQSTPTPTPTQPAGTGSLTPTPTGSLSLTPTPTGSDNATPSAVTVTTPRVNQTFETVMPTFSGTAPPGSTVTIAIYSSQQITATVVADEDGNWSYTVDEALESGDHTIIVAAQNPDTGETNTATIAFAVSDGSPENDETDLAGDEMPVSGTVETTLLMLGLGVLLLLSGSLVPLLFRGKGV